MAKLRENVPEAPIKPCKRLYSNSKARLKTMKDCLADIDNPVGGGC